MVTATGKREQVSTVINDLSMHFSDLTFSVAASLSSAVDARVLHGSTFRNILANP